MASDEIDDYEIRWPEGDVRSVRLPNGQTLWPVFDRYGVDVLQNHYFRKNSTSS